MLLLQVLQDEPRPPRRLNDKIPRDLETICLKAMAKEPARRYATARRAGRRPAPLPRAASRSAPGPSAWPSGSGAGAGGTRCAASLLAAVSLGSAVGLWHLSRALGVPRPIDGPGKRGPAVRDARGGQRALQLRGRGSAPVARGRRHPRLRHQGRRDPAAGDVHHRVGPGDRQATARRACGSGSTATSRSAPARTAGRRRLRARRPGGAAAATPTAPVYRFETFQGRPSLRYATARRMQADCVGCHNTTRTARSGTGRTGDVRGVLEIIRPLDRDIARTREGLRGTFRAHGRGLRSCSPSPAWSWWSAADGSWNPLRAIGLKLCNAPALGGE